MAVSCSNDDEVLQPEQKADGTTTVRATTEYTQVPATRTLFGTPTTTDAGKTYSIPLTWNDDPTTESVDVVGFKADGMPTYSLSTFTGVERSEDGKSMEFDISSGYPEGNNVEKYVFLYPKGAFMTNGEDVTNSNSPVYLNATQAQSGNDNRDHLPAVNWMYSDAVDEGEDFTLHPLGAIVRFDLTFPTAVKGGTITLSSDKSSFICGIPIQYSDGKASATYFCFDNSQSLTISGIDTKNVIGYMMVGATSDFDGLQDAALTLEAVMTNGDGTSNTYTKELGTTKSDANWQPGKCYNFAATFTAPTITWAGSNIYWDGEKLTFDAANATTTHPYYQGVYFKWGSLVGISPAQTDDETGTKRSAWTGNETVYVPTYSSSSPTSSTWSDATATDAEYTTYGSIPYETEDFTGDYGKDKSHLYHADVTATATINKWNAKIGDICQFIGETNPALKGYRMPRSDEFGTYESDGSGDWGIPDGTFGTDYLGTPDGKAPLTSKGFTTWNASGAIFPAAGYRNTDGTLNNVGNFGYYWSNSANNTSYGFDMYFFSSSVTPSGISDRQCAFPVRCVKN
jgi:hypothetical protein